MWIGRDDNLEESGRGHKGRLLEDCPVTGRAAQTFIMTKQEDEARANQLCRKAIDRAQAISQRLQTLDERQKQTILATLPKGTPESEWLLVGDPCAPYARFWRPRFADAFDAFASAVERRMARPGPGKRPVEHIREACPPCEGPDCSEPGAFIADGDSRAYCSVTCASHADLERQMNRITLGR